MTHQGIRGVDVGWLARLLLELGIDVEVEPTGGNVMEGYSDERLATALGAREVQRPSFRNGLGNTNKIYPVMYRWEWADGRSCSHPGGGFFGWGWHHVSLPFPIHYGNSIDDTLRDAGPVLSERGLFWKLQSHPSDCSILSCGQSAAVFFRHGSLARYRFAARADTLAEACRNAATDAAEAIQ